MRFPYHRGDGRRCFSDGFDGQSRSRPLRPGLRDCGQSRCDQGANRRRRRLWPWGCIEHKITLTDGVVDQANFDTYEPLRLSDMPAVDVHIVKSNQPPTGVGEPGVPPIAPAVSNAIFVATGKSPFTTVRFRTLEKRRKIYNRASLRRRTVDLWISMSSPERAASTTREQPMLKTMANERSMTACAGLTYHDNSSWLENDRPNDATGPKGWCPKCG